NVETVIYTGTGNFLGTGNELANSMTGGAGDDTLDGGTAADTMTGGLGNDTYVVDDGADLVVEKSAGGTDTVQTVLAAYTLAAQVENLVYTGAGNFSGTGNTLANNIGGGAGNDSINGGSGNDTIDGGAGVDLLTGGTGNDVFVFHSGETNGDTVADFATGKDHIQFAGFGAGSTFAQANATDWIITDGVDHHSETIHFANHPLIHATDVTFI
ncbi:MAG TPA: calcium-binding protein, partial [Micropepsaceae bacterium]|nr:calcium-binding protein [Micropepsaceae bacterium]